MAPAADDPRGSAHDLLLQLAGGLLDAQPALRHEPSGRPVVDGLAVSLSHSTHLVAVAATRSPGPPDPPGKPSGLLGVDLEDRTPREYAALARRWFASEELTWMDAQADPFTAFLHLWTAKEAVGKALGQGLRSGGLRRPMPLPDLGGAASRAAPADTPANPLSAVEQTGTAITSGELTATGGRRLTVLYPRLTADAVLAVAVAARAGELVVSEHHGAALRRTVTSRTSLPVVVRGS